MGDVTFRAASEHLPWLLILAPVIATPLAVLCERMLRGRRARLRGDRLRELLGEPRTALSPTLTDSSDALTLCGELQGSSPEATALTWNPTEGEAAHVSAEKRWTLVMEDARVALEGPLEIRVGSEESADGTPVPLALDDALDGCARLIRTEDRVRVRGRLLVEPVSAPRSAEGYRGRDLSARMLPLEDAITVVAETAPRVALRPSMVRVARLTMTLSLAFAVLPALTVFVLQWRTMQHDMVARAHCEQDLATALERHQPWDAADLAPECGSIETEADVAWHNAEMPVAARNYRRLRSDRATLEIHPSNAASQIIAGRYDEAARVIYRMSMRSRNGAALRCLAAGLRYMHEPDQRWEDDLREGAEEEQRQLRSTANERPITCTPMLAEAVGEYSVLDRQVNTTFHHGAAPGYFNTYLAALLAAEKVERLDHPLLLHVLDARYPPLASQQPRNWALHHPIALSTSLMRRLKPETTEQHLVSAAFSAQKALFDAYMGEGELAIAALTRVRALADTPAHIERDQRTHIFIVGAAAALLIPDLGAATTLLELIPPEDTRKYTLAKRLALRKGIGHDAFTQLAIMESHRPSAALWQAAEGGQATVVSDAVRAAPIGEIHGFLPFAAELLRDDGGLQDWLEAEFPALCETCGLRALAEHIAARRVASVALDHAVAPRLAEPARRVHAAMLRRDVAVPLYLLARIVEANRVR